MRVASIKSADRTHRLTTPNGRKYPCSSLRGGRKVRNPEANLMRKLLLAFCLVSAISAFSQSNSSAHPGDRPSKELMVAYCDAWSTGGPDKAAAFYDKSPDNVFFDIAPLKYKGWAEYEPGVKQMLSTFETAKLTLGDDVAIHPAGNWAW